MFKKYFFTLNYLRLISYLIFAVFGIIVVCFLVQSYQEQQTDVEDLNGEVKALEKKINNLALSKSAIELKDKRGLQKDVVALKKDLIALEKDIYGVLIQAVGGAVVLFGIFFTWRNLRVSQEGQITERFTNAITQLGDDKLEIRLGGIYALERIAKDSKKDYWIIMEVLTSFIQQKSRLNLSNNNQEEKHKTLFEYFSEHFNQYLSSDSQEKIQEITADVQASLTVIGRRDFSKDLKVIDLSFANLQGAMLAGTKFQKAMLAYADLRGARLWKAKLQEADLRVAKLQKANLQGANLQGANLQGANLRQANLQGADLQGADLTGVEFCQTIMFDGTVNNRDCNKSP